jgi:prepilin-type N-terminal cleavage/methylation domain-containing protein
MKFSKRKGFTLIELMVVISIISLLSSIVLSSINSARAKSRDTKRISEMKSMQIAIEMARSADVQIPSSNDYWPIINLSGILVPTYISSIPSDPNTSLVPTTYYYCNTNTQGDSNYCHNDTDPNTYAIVFFTENNIGPCPKYNGNWHNVMCCLTSSGIFPGELGNNPGSSAPNFYKYCTQR